MVSCNQADLFLKPESDGGGPNDVGMCEECGTPDSVDKSPSFNDDILSPRLEGCCYDNINGHMK